MCIGPADVMCWCDVSPAARGTQPHWQGPSSSTFHLDLHSTVCLVGTLCCWSAAKLLLVERQMWSDMLLVIDCVGALVFSGNDHSSQPWLSSVYSMPRSISSSCIAQEIHMLVAKRRRFSLSNRVCRLPVLFWGRFGHIGNQPHTWQDHDDCFKMLGL